VWTRQGAAQLGLGLAHLLGYDRIYRRRRRGLRRLSRRVGGEDQGYKEQYQAQGFGISVCRETIPDGARQARREALALQRPHTNVLGRISLDRKRR
jgi:hypothetical protein